MTISSPGTGCGPMPSRVGDSGFDETSPSDKRKAKSNVSDCKDGSQVDTPRREKRTRRGERKNGEPSDKKDGDSRKSGSQNSGRDVKPSKNPLQIKHNSKQPNQDKILIRRLVPKNIRMCAIVKQHFKYDTNRPFWTPRRYNNYKDEDIELFRKYDNTFERIDYHSEHNYNPHPFMSNIRTMCESYSIYKCIETINAVCNDDPTFELQDGWIHDWGGAPRRHHNNKRGYIHSTVPNELVSDLTQHFSEGLEYCNDKAQDCVCKTYLCSISVHSLYYFTPDDIINILSKQVIPVHYATIHPVHLKQRDHCKGEMTIEYVDDYCVAQARGNSHKYIHSNMDWMNEQCYVGIKGTLVWTLVRDIEGVHVYKFTYTPRKHYNVKQLPKDYKDKPVNNDEIYTKLCDARFMYSEIGKPKAFKTFVDAVKRKADEYINTNPTTTITSTEAQIFAADYWLRFPRETSRHSTFFLDDVKQIDNYFNLIPGGAYKWFEVLAICLFLAVLYSVAVYLVSMKDMWWHYIYYVSILLITIYIRYNGDTIVKFSTNVRYLYNKYFVARRDYFELNLFGSSYRTSNCYVKTSCVPSNADYNSKKLLKYRRPEIVCNLHKPMSAPLVFHPDHIPVFYAGCSHNNDRCVKERIGQFTPKLITVPEVPQMLIAVLYRISNSLVPLTWEEWVSRFKPQRQKSLRRDMELYLNGTPIKRKKSFFIKNEPMVSTEKAPRPIHSSNVHESFEIGRWMIPFTELLAVELLHEKVLFPLHGDYELQSQFVMDHMHKGVIANDFGKFDATQSDKLRLLKFNCYKIGGIPTEVIDILERDLEHITIQGPNGMKYCTRDVHHSGDSDTLTGNTLINIIVISSACMEMNVQIPPMIVKGDDSLSFATEDLSLMNHYLTTYGMKSDLKQIDDLDLEFCSNLFIPTDNGLSPIPKLGRFLAKTLWNRDVFATHEDNVVHYSGILKGLMTTVSDMPVYRAFYKNKFYSHNVKIIIDDHKIMANEIVSSNYSTFRWFCQRYDISMDDIFEMENEIEEINNFPHKLQHPAFTKIISIDWAPPNYNKDRTLVEKPISPINFNWCFDLFPILEELFKYYFGIPGLMLLAIVESVVKSSTFPLLGHTILFLIMQSYGLKVSIVAHLLWNYLTWEKLNIVPRLCKMKNNNKRRTGGKAPVSKQVKNMTKRFAKNALVSAGATLGGYAGSHVGQPALGRRFGSSAGKAISRIMGVGDYVVDGTKVGGMQVPSFSDGNRRVRIAHKEFLTNITGSDVFTNTVVKINPGLIASFPWLSTLANNFDQYKLISCVYYFKSTSATALNSTNTALGTVIMATQYNSTRSPPGSKLEMENMEFSTSVKPSEDCIHAVECNPSEKTVVLQYIRNGGISENDDLRFYDLGSFNIATVGMQAAAVIGELWVSYEVEFYKPLVQANLYNSSWARISSTDPTIISLFGTTSTRYGNLEVIPVISGQGKRNRLNFPSSLSLGYYYVSLNWRSPNSTSASTIDLTVTGTNCTLQSCFGGDNSLDQFSDDTTISGVSINNYMINFVVKITATGSSILLNSTAFLAGVTSFDGYIMEVGDVFRTPVSPIV